MENSYCRECMKETQVTFDHAAGDSVCTECGLVLEARTVDETSEWRTFTDEADGHDPNRVGAASNPLLREQLTATVIAGPGADIIGRLQHRTTKNPDRSLIEAFRRIGYMCDGLSLVSTIKDRANEIYKKVEDLKPMKGRKLDAILAACLYIACREDGKPRTMKELLTVANGASKKDIGRAKDFIVKQLEIDCQPIEMGTIHAKDFLRRFCSNLGMRNQTVKVVEEAVQKSEGLDVRRSPISVAAGVIYMITQLSAEEKKSIKDISGATGVAEGTIKNAYRDLYPYASMIIPAYFANNQDLKKLCNPSH